MMLYPSGHITWGYALLSMLNLTPWWGSVCQVSAVKVTFFLVINYLRGDTLPPCEYLRPTNFHTAHLPSINTLLLKQDQ